MGQYLFEIQPATTDVLNLIGGEMPLNLKGVNGEVVSVSLE